MSRRWTIAIDLSDRWVLFRLAAWAGAGFVFGIGVLGGIGAIVGMLVLPTDDSDVSRFDRSGFRIYSDARTGIEYVAGPAGTCLTPRLGVGPQP